RDDTSADYKQVTQALWDAQGRLEAYLDRRLLVCPVTQRVVAYHTEKTSAGAVRYVWAREWPVVQVVTEGVEVDDVTAEAERLKLVSSVSEVEVFGGYRGRQHTLDGAGGSTALTGLDGLEDLEELPPLLPGLLRGVILDLAFVTLDDRRSGTVGGKRKTQFLPSGNVISEGRRASAEEEILARAERRRRLT